MFPDVEAFRAWLLARRDAWVGLAVNSRVCPLATWLSEVNGEALWVSDGRYGFSDWSWGYGYSSPEWAFLFERALDEECFLDEEVLGEQALRVLEALSL